jgi:hypothetical protein
MQWGTSPFISTAPMFAAPYLFDARLYKCKTYTGTSRDTIHLKVITFLTATRKPLTLLTGMVMK